MIILHHTGIVLLFIIAAFVQLQHERAIYLQKKIDGPVYEKLERQRKHFRVCLVVCFFAAGCLVTFAKTPLRLLPAYALGASAFWVLFDGWFATRVMHKSSWWFEGRTSQVDAVPGNFKWLKISALVFSLIAEILNMIL